MGQVQLNAGFPPCCACLESTAWTSARRQFLSLIHIFRPVESPTAGIFLSGACQGPKDIPETVAQAGAAAAKVIGLLAKDHLTCNPCVARPDEAMCNGCSACEKVCPYGAITYEDKEFRGPDRKPVMRRVAQVNPAVCQGCGCLLYTSACRDHQRKNPGVLPGGAGAAGNHNWLRR